jgi:MYXO-CTERM domain-containing protein
MLARQKARSSPSGVRPAGVIAAVTSAALALLGAIAAGLRRRRRRMPGHAAIISPRKSTVIAADGAVRSAQVAEISVPEDRLEQLWTPANLENLGRTYWRFLTRVTLGLVRVIYGRRERAVVLVSRPFTLLRFDSPEYLLEADHGNIRWRIHDGLLVARAGRGCGFLALDVSRERIAGEASKLRIEVEVANFYPSIAAGLSIPVYMVTQGVIHVAVTHAFLRSLARLDLAESKVKALADLPGSISAESPDAPEPADAAAGP